MIKKCLIFSKDMCLITFKYALNDIRQHWGKSLLIFFALFFMIIIALSSNKLVNGIENYLTNQLSDPILNNVKLISTDYNDMVTETKANELNSLKWFEFNKPFEVNINSKVYKLEAGRYSFNEKFLKEHNLKAKKLKNKNIGISVPTHFDTLKQDIDNILEPIEFYTTNTQDPIFKKVKLLELKDNGWIQSDKYISNVLTYDNMKGIILTKEKYETLKVTNSILNDVIFWGNSYIDIKVLGVVDKLPFNKDALITETYYRNLYNKNSNDKIPDYKYIIFYFDNVNDIIDISKSIKLINLSLDNPRKIEEVRLYQNIIDTVNYLAFFVLSIIAFISFPFILSTFQQQVLHKRKQISWMLCFSSPKTLQISFFLVEGNIILLLSSSVATTIFITLLSPLIDGLIKPFILNSKDYITYFSVDSDFYWILPLSMSLILSISILLGVISILKINPSKVLRGM